MVKGNVKLYGSGLSDEDKIRRLELAMGDVLIELVSMHGRLRKLEKK